MAIETFMLHRRALLSAAGAGALGAVLGWRGAFASAAMPRLVAAARIDGVDSGAVWSPDGLYGFTLPARAHAAISIPSSDRVLLVGRRPGEFAALFHSGDPEAFRLLPPLDGHRFTGHAAAAHAGLVASSELHAESAAGVAVIRDPEMGVIRDTWPLGGIEPHELLFADSGARLVVALGGIAKSAGAKGPPENLGRIESAIVELDAKSGRVLQRHRLAEDLATLSMRHMAAAPDGRTVAFGMQDQDKSRVRPLMGILRLGQGIELLPLPADDPGALRFYVGSVAIDAAGEYLAATSPVGGTVALWSLSDGRYLGRLAADDISGLAADPEPGYFWATSGLGDVMRLKAGQSGLAADASWHVAANFDNHLLLI